jgi:hypothetical protein
MVLALGCNPGRGLKEGNAIRPTDLYHVETLGLAIDTGCQPTTKPTSSVTPSLHYISTDRDTLVVVPQSLDGPIVFGQTHVPRREGSGPLPAGNQRKVRVVEGVVCANLMPPAP